MTSLEKLLDYIQMQIKQAEKAQVELNAKWEVLQDMKQAVERELENERKKGA